ncbi:hypothetical protein K8D15_15840 [Citrobacter youngae]|uniref:hypothetical protein n=1 Tax=Citrobacter youngae TaxID=133448 RepID=UPI00207CF6C3|nr:hypothetical protein [Citrobacter youngae]MCO4164654.1 hypothetical protein [Citrobacter youngae]
MSKLFNNVAIYIYGKYFLPKALPFKGKPVPLILPSFQPLPLQFLFAIFIPSVFEVVQVGQVVQPRQPWLCAVPPEKCLSEKWDRISNGCPTLYHFFKPNSLSGTLKPAPALRVPLVPLCPTFF